MPVDEEQRFENAQLKKFREEKKKLLDTSAEFDMLTIQQVPPSPILNQRKDR